MSARAEYGPLSWEEIEQNRCENLEHHLAAGQSGDFFRDGSEAPFRVSLPESKPAVGMPEEWNSLLHRRERLRGEIKRGKEYLEQIQTELAESRLLLEKWTAYERQCGRNPLPQLAHSISINERIEQFLPGWLKRQEKALAGIITELELSGEKNKAETQQFN